MSFTPKVWKDLPAETTSISAAALIDLETRLAAYAATVPSTVPGPTGPTGPTGLTGPAGVGANWRGIWSSGTTYAVGDGVSGSDGNNYVSQVASNLNHNPVGDAGVHWNLIGELPPGWVGAKSNFGAKGDGTTDDTTAINAMLTYLKTNGGTGYFEPGTYVVAGVLNGDSNAKPYTLQGPGGGNSGQVFASVIKFTGTGAVNGLTLNSTFGIELCYLQFTHTNAMTGSLVFSDGHVHGPDSQYSNIHHCSFSGKATPTATAGITMNATNVWNIHDSEFGHCLNGIQVGTADYVVACTIGPNNIFDNNSVSCIVINGTDIENLVITGNTFEMDVGVLTPYGIKGNDTLFAANSTGLQACTISYNWFADSGGQTVNYVHNLITWSAGKTSAVIGNYFGPSGGVALDGFKGKWLSMSNTFDCVAYNNTGTSTTGDYNKCNLTAISNDHFGVAAFSGAARPGTYTDLGNAATHTTLPTRLALSGANGGVLTLDTTGDGPEEFMVFGSQISTLPAGVLKALLYYQATSPNPKLMLQAPWDGSTGSVQLLGGATPTVALSLKNGNLLQFYGSGSEVAQASRAGQLTDSTGGSVTSTLAAGITDTVAKNAIASLAAKVNALELIIHNLGLSA
jgi:hypothetical protein